MFWAVVIVIAVLIVASLDSIFGKIVVGAAVVAIGMLLLRWITGLAVFVTLAKACAVLMVIMIVGVILIVIING